MPRFVQKFSVVYLSTRDETQVFRSGDEMPEEIRERIRRLARTSRMETRIIANDKGRELLELEQVEDKSTMPHTLPRAARWALVAMLGAGLGILLTWVQRIY